MAARTQVVVTTVGPYNRYGMPLVAACAAAGTDYADLTGEAIFIRRPSTSITSRPRRRRRDRADCCRFDYVPSDLSVYAPTARRETTAPAG